MICIEKILNGTETQFPQNEQEVIKLANSLRIITKKTEFSENSEEQINNVLRYILDEKFKESGENFIKAVSRFYRYMCLDNMERPAGNPLWIEVNKKYD